MGYDPGLIRYASESELEGHKTHWLRPRLVGYVVAILVMVTAFSWRIVARVPLEMTVIRDRNQLYTETASGRIANIYTLEILNMDDEMHSYTLRIEGLENARIEGDSELILNASEVRTVPLRVSADKEDFDRPSTAFRFVIESDDGSGLKRVAESRFLIPSPGN